MPRTTEKDQTPDAPDPRGGRRPRGAGGSQRAVTADAEATRPTQRPSGAMTDLGATPPAPRRPSGPEAGDTATGPEAAPGRHGIRDQAAPPTYDDIARRAYELYQERGGRDGQEVDDWLRAEAELRNGRGRRDDEI